MKAAAVIIFTAVLAVGAAVAHQSGAESGRLDFTPSVPLVRLGQRDGASGVAHVRWTPKGAPRTTHETIRLFVDEWVRPGAEYTVTDLYTTRHNHVTHVYLRQRLNGLDVANSEANINIRDGTVLSANHRFFMGDLAKAPQPIPTLSAPLALRALGRYMHIDYVRCNLTALPGKDGVEYYQCADLSLDVIPARLFLLQTEGGKDLRLVWSLVVRQADHWLDAYVDMDGTVLALYDWVAQESYLAFPLSVDNPSDGEREVITDPAEPVASPLGWHDQGNGRVFTTTIGNNVYAQENIDGSTASDWIENFRPSGDDTNTYIFTIDYDQEPIEYLNASITSLFFANNLIHDVFYQYGFDEVSGNFQENNFNRGGLGNDAVQANGQDGAGINNANFATPPDGQRPRMRMYLYDYTEPMRDGCLAIGTVIHEYSHGISNRLTGGPSNTNCLGADEAGGMGEGWGDFHAVLFRQRPEYTRDDVFAFGNWQRNLTDSIRPYNYATDMTINPTTYDYINGHDYDGVHAKGCVWATALYDGYWNIVDKEGFEPDLYSRRGGNGIVLQDVVDGMKLQPCRPTFLDARDAILLADEVNYDGAHVCDWWQAFAKRGMGVNAVSTPNGVTESFELPTACRTTPQLK